MDETWSGHDADTGGAGVPDWFVEAVQAALQHLYDPAALRASRLLKLFSVGEQAHPAAALRRILIEAVEGRKPDASIPLQSNAWREYHILYFRFVEQSLQGEVADDLGLSTRHLRRHEGQALALLANDLWQRFRLGDSQSGEAPAPDAAAKAVEQTPSYEEEIHWLQASHAPQHVDVASLLEGVTERVRPLLHARGTALEVQLAPGLPAVAVQIAPATQAITSLLLSAGNQAGPGALRISAQQAGDAVVVAVQPQGEAVAAPDREQWATAQSLLQLTGGSVRRVGPRRDQIRISLPAAGGVSVLSIDDNPDTLHLLMRYVSGTRYRLVGVENPAQALALAQTAAPDIITVDVMLPGMDGWDLLGRLREHPNLRHVPVIVCTILPQDQLAYALGADGFVRKPVKREEFLLALDRVWLSAGEKRLADAVDQEQEL